MANSFYNAGGVPAQGSGVTSANMRAEFSAVASGFDKFPTLSGNAYKVVFVNAAGTALDIVGGTGLLKLSTSGIPSIATVRTDYAEPTTALATGILKNTTGTGAHTIATVRTDYAEPTTALATGLLKNTTGTGAHTIATVRTDYAEPTTGLATGILKNTTGTGAHTIAVAGTDFQAPIGTISGVAKGNGANALTAATAGTDFVSPSVATNFTATQRADYNTTTATSTYNFAGADQIINITLTTATTVTFGAPSGLVTGAYYTFILTAGDTSARTYAWNSAYKFPQASSPLVTATATSGAVDIITFIALSATTAAYVGHQSDCR